MSGHPPWALRSASPNPAGQAHWVGRDMVSDSCALISLTMQSACWKAIYSLSRYRLEGFHGFPEVGLHALPVFGEHRLLGQDCEGPRTGAPHPSDALQQLLPVLGQVQVHPVVEVRHVAAQL